MGIDFQFTVAIPRSHPSGTRPSKNEKNVPEKKVSFWRGSVKLIGWADSLRSHASSYLNSKPWSASEMSPQRIPSNKTTPFLFIGGLLWRESWRLTSRAENEVSSFFSFQEKKNVFNGFYDLLRFSSLFWTIKRTDAGFKTTEDLNEITKSESFFFKRSNSYSLVTKALIPAFPPSPYLYKPLIIV